MKELRSYQNSDNKLKEYGVSIGLDGIPVNIVNIDESKLIDYMTVENIASSLSRLIRYRGDSVFSVAQHSVRMADAFLLMGEPVLAKAALYHDAIEILTGDISNIIKNLKGVKEVIKEIEHKLESVLFPAWGLPYPLPQEIKIMDKNCAQDEMFDLVFGYSYPLRWTEEQSYKAFIEMDRKLKLYLELYYKNEN